MKAKTSNTYLDPLRKDITDDIVWGRKYIKFVRGGKLHNLFSRGICCVMEITIYRIERSYKGTIFDPDEVLKIGIDTVYDLRKLDLDKLYSFLSDLSDAIDMSYVLYNNSDMEPSSKLDRWCKRYNEVAKEFSRVHKTKVKVFVPWWQDAKEG